MFISKKLLYFLLFPLLLLFCSFDSTGQVQVEYELGMSQPHSHYFEVSVNIHDVQTLSTARSENYVEVSMPVWTPGSYLEREYAKNVEGFEAYAGKKALVWEKISKNTWKIQTQGAESIRLSYKVYAFELTVRNAYLDDSHGYFNGAAVFMYVPELANKKSHLTIIPHESFSKVSIELPEIGKNKFEVENFDLLVDSPGEVGNHEVLEFEAAGVKHRIANYSNVKLEYDKQKLISDYKKVVEGALSVVGEHPCKSYLFIIHHLPGIGGGLEHLNSTTCHTTPNAYKTESGYRSFMGLLAHEYFHLWNVKRIRPFALGPFDYGKENYTHMLWVSEGFTSFYQNDIVRRAGLTSEEQFLNTLSSSISSIENTPGNKVQSVAESSWDAWIKYYRPNENSDNSTVSYYTKGGVIANILNLIILKETRANKSLDDVFRYLWDEYYKKSDRGYTDEEFRKACERVAGVSLKSFFEKHIYDTETIDYARYFAYAGLKIADEKAGENPPYFGVRLRPGGAVVTRVEKGSGAYENGIYVNDEIISIDGKDFEGVAQFTQGKKIGDSILVKVKRSGQYREYTIPLKRNPEIKYALKKADKLTSEEQKIYNKLVHKK